jgi:hypothetical protein
MVPPGYDERSRHGQHRHFGATSACEEDRDLIAFGRDVLPSELDQLAAEGSVEEQVARELGQF